LPQDLTINAVKAPDAAKEPALAARAPNVRKTADAAQKFEAFVLQSFIQEMMPETQESVFGGGISGDFWKSMMSEKIAEQVAARGGIGIADKVRIARDVPVRSSGFNPLDVMDHVASAGGSQSTLDILNPVSGK
jgi:Rod binding domain-containing protein